MKSLFRRHVAPPAKRNGFVSPDGSKASNLAVPMPYYDFVSAVAAKRGCSRAAVIRDALDHYRVSVATDVAWTESTTADVERRQTNETVVPDDWRDQTVVPIPVGGRILCDLSRSASYSAARSGDLPTIRVGHRMGVPVARLRRMLGELPEVAP